MDVLRVPERAREVSGALVDVDMLHELRVEVRIPERPVRHQLIIEVPGMLRVALQPLELRELCLRGTVVEWTTSCIEVDHYLQLCVGLDIRRRRDAPVGDTFEGRRKQHSADLTELVRDFR
jgi:hypothetical protein